MLLVAPGAQFARTNCNVSQIHSRPSGGRGAEKPVFVQKDFANRELLERNAAACYTQIELSTSDERQKAKLLDVAVDWMLQIITSSHAAEMSQDTENLGTRNV